MSLQKQKREKYDQILKKVRLLLIYILTLIRESWKKIQNAGPSPSAFSGKNPERSVASFVYVSVLWFFSGNRAR